MKILAITAYYPPHHSGGYELRCYEVLEGLIQKGHSIVVLTSRCPDSKCSLHQSEDGVKRILHLRRDATSVFTQVRWDCIDLKYIEKTVQEYPPDLIYLWHIQDLSNSILPYFSSRPIPIVYDEGGSGLIHLSKVYQRGLYFYNNQHDHLVKKLIKKGIYAVSKLVSLNLINPYWRWPKQMRIYFNSNGSKTNTLNHGVPVEEAAVIPSGIDITKFPFQTHKRLGNPVRVIVPGRIKKEKGIRDVVYLALKFQDKGIGIKITVVGEVQSIEYYSEIRQLIRDNCIDDVITFIGMVDQEKLSKLYRENDFCFFPSYFKSGFSRVPLEAMASGCTVISYGNEGSDEIIQDKENGFVVGEGDFETVKNIISNLSEKPEEFQKVSRKGRMTIESQFLMNKYIERIQDFLIGNQV